MDFKTMSKGNFFSMLLHSLNYFRIAHWEQSGVGSYASHVAIGEFYDILSDNLDKLVETTIGIEGYNDIEVPKTTYKRKTLEFSQSLFSFIESNKKMFEYSFQQNIIDEIQTELAKLMYKLKMLK